MTIILASLLRYYMYSENGEKLPVALCDVNGIVGNIKKHLPHAKKFVCVANDPKDSADNDECMRVLCRSLEFAKIHFEKCVLLDARNADKAAKILEGASLIVLRGGKCDGQLEFLRSIDFCGALARSSAVVVGVSAGAMNLCGTVANFPEELADLDRPRSLDGLGLCDLTVIPHFDGDLCEYRFACDDFDIAKDYILPMSQGRRFIGMDNDGYILIDGQGNRELHGGICVIGNGAVQKINGTVY